MRLKAVVLAAGNDDGSSSNSGNDRTRGSYFGRILNDFYGNLLQVLEDESIEQEFVN
jgi:hypothetical protein